MKYLKTLTLTELALSPVAAIAIYGMIRLVINLACLMLGLPTE